MQWKWHQAILFSISYNNKEKQQLDRTCGRSRISEYLYMYLFDKIKKQANKTLSFPKKVAIYQWDADDQN